MRMKKKKQKQILEEFGSMKSYCPNCDHTFSVPWQIIFDLQECTHGYVGYEYFHEEFIACPRCGKNANRQDDLYSIIENPEDEEWPL
ncbi:hypothetical protein [Brevibacillus sp. H7]|uniref:hypothetical protein n=1 Tax=Brevibacillus sp. H7 TaxID=3349138 RepID=UPI00380F87EA